MTKIELEKKLINQKIPKYAYSLIGGFPNEAYCLNYDGNIWEVYYSERGQKTDLKTFFKEKEACDFFYDWLIKSLKKMGITN